METIFYRTDDVFAMLILVLAKGRKQGITFNLFFETQERCDDFSRMLWNSGSALPHGLFVDQFYEMQPILVLMQDQYEENMHKDCAFFIECEAKLNLKQWQKVCYVNDAAYEYKQAENVWEYIGGKWQTLAKK